jgi:hypothetical protein
MESVNKIISIGSNCISLDFPKYLGVRERGPVDNFAGFNIWNSPLLFNNEFKKAVFCDKYKSRPATAFELKKYYFEDKVFVFEKGFSIVHNNFESHRFRHGLKKRIHNFHKYYKASLKDSSLWYLYSLDYSDVNLSENNLYRIKAALPKNVASHLICLGIRAKNPSFQKYFKYYVEWDNEEIYRWGDKTQGIEIANLLEKKYHVRINYE